MLHTFIRELKSLAEKNSLEIIVVLSLHKQKIYQNSLRAQKTLCEISENFYIVTCITYNYYDFINIFIDLVPYLRNYFVTSKSSQICPSLTYTIVKCYFHCFCKSKSPI